MGKGGKGTINENDSTSTVIEQPHIGNSVSASLEQDDGYEETQTQPSGKLYTMMTASSQQQQRHDFYWSTTDEPHATRRKLILAKHPEIKQLYGHCWMLKYKVLAAMALQLTLAYHFRNVLEVTSVSKIGWVVYFATAYVVGGTCNHMLLMALHELSHNLGFKQMKHNRWFAMFANIPVVVPAAVSFKRYHMDHHKFQGVDVMDVDIPTVLEGKFFNNALTKLCFVFWQVLFYSLRPAFVNAKPPGMGELINWLVIVSADLAIVYFWGLPSLLYLLASSVLGMGLHPVAGHFIAEHFVFPHLNQQPKQDEDPAETYSYYGFCNYFTLNVGYHNEHHDFPFVPGSRLPLVKQIAGEFYDDLPHHTSYCKVLWDFIFDARVTAFSRVKRAATGADVGGVEGADPNVIPASSTTASNPKKVQ